MTISYVTGEEYMSQKIIWVVVREKYLFLCEMTFTLKKIVKYCSVYVTSRLTINK